MSEEFNLDDILKEVEVKRTTHQFAPLSKEQIRAYNEQMRSAPAVPATPPAAAANAVAADGAQTSIQDRIQQTFNNLGAKSEPAQSAAPQYQQPVQPAAPQYQQPAQSAAPQYQQPAQQAGEQAGEYRERVEELLRSQRAVAERPLSAPPQPAAPPEVNRAPQPVFRDSEQTASTAAVPAGNTQLEGQMTMDSVIVHDGGEDVEARHLDSMFLQDAYVRTHKEKQPEQPLTRSLRALLSEEPYEAPDEKGVLAPTIERGFEVVADDEVAKSETENPAPTADPAAHPLFTESVEPPATIEQLARDAQPYAQPLPAPTAPPQPSGELLIDDAVKQVVEREGVINLSAKVDDEFRQFFGDTVIIDRQPLDTKLQKQRKIKDFIMEPEQGEPSGPVFEDEQQPPAQKAEIEEYRSEDDAEPILAELMSRQARSAIVMLFTGVCGVLLCVFNALSYYKLPQVEPLTASFTTFCIINAALAAVAAVLNIKAVGRGFAKLVTFKSDADAVCAFAVFFALCEPVLMLLFSAGRDALVAAPVCTLALMFYDIGRFVYERNLLRNFKSISESAERYASTVYEDEPQIERAARALGVDHPAVMLKRRTGFTDNFMRYALSPDRESRIFRIPVSVVFIVSLLAAALGYFTGGSAENAVAAAALCAALSCSFMATLKSSLPLARMQNALLRVGTVVPGFEAADIVTDADSVLFEGRDLFPKGSVLLHGIKTFEKERIDKAILYAASVLIPSCDTLSNLFYNVIQGKSDMLYETDSIDYEDRLGFSCWMDKTRVLIGNREMMSNHEIKIPSQEYEQKYRKDNTRDAIYLAVGGNLYAMFMVSYTADNEVAAAVGKLDAEGIGLLVRTRDFNITREKVASVFELDESAVAVISDQDAQAVADYTSYVPHSDSVLTHIGSLPAYVRGIVGCSRLHGSLRTANLMALVAMILGCVLGLVVSVAGTVGAISVVPAVVFHMIWFLIITLATQFIKY